MPLYFESSVHMLLIELLERHEAFQRGDIKKTGRNAVLAQEAKRLITMERLSSKEKVYTISRLCRELGTNPYSLKTSFKWLLGISIVKYRQSVSMEYARVLLDEGKQSIEEVSIALGYGATNSFSTAFKNHCGYTAGG